MKKKLLAIALMLAMAFAFTACGGGGSESADSQDGQQTESSANANSDTLSCDAGEIKYVGFEKADPLLTDEEGAYVFIFEYTNNQDDPSECQQTFNVQFFQNGAELTNQAGWKSEAQEQYDLVNAFFNDALKGGTVKFGKIVIPQDDSPVTVMLTENANSDNRAMTEVNLGDAAAGSSDSESDTSVDIGALIQGEWVIPDADQTFFRFENDTLSLVESASGSVLAEGAYTVNNDGSTIDATLKATDKDLSIHLPYKVEDGTLHLFNNQNVEFEHK